MRSIKRKNRIIAFMLSCMMVLTLFIGSAISASAVTTISADGSNIMKAALNKTVDGYNVTLSKLYYFDASGNKVSYKMFIQQGSNSYKFNSDAFAKTESGLQQASLSTLARYLNNSDTKISSADRTKIYNEIKNNCDSATASMIGVLFEDSKADMFSALQLFGPFSGVVGTILGCGVLILVILLLASTVLDLCYIGLPVARNWINVKSDEKSGGQGGKPWGITNDAFSVINETETGNTSSGGKYKNAYALYFKRRVVTYIILSICILYLLSGQIAGLIGWLMSLVSGFSM